MGRGSRLKASMVSVMESKPSSLSPQASFVSCLSCYYCDCVSFDETDVNTYAAHLRDSHSITRNVESLVALTLKEQQSRPEVVTPPAPTAVVQPPVFNLPTTEMTMDWMDDDVGGVMVEDDEPEEDSKEGKGKSRGGDEELARVCKDSAGGTRHEGGGARATGRSLCPACQVGRVRLVPTLTSGFSSMTRHADHSVREASCSQEGWTMSRTCYNLLLL